MTVDLQLLFHGACFDGLMSAAIFTRFYRTCLRPGAVIAYRGMAHGRGDPYGPDHDATFFAEDNAVVDFRYSPSERLTWWCDHHESAFLADEDRAHFAARVAPQHCFDPTAPSCAGLLARWLTREHGFDASTIADHVRWADLIDSASFESPQQAVRLREPALQLMALLDSAPAAGLVETLIETLSSSSLEAAHALPEVRHALQPVLDRHAAHVELMRQRLIVRQGVAFFDLSQDGVDGVNKFIPYDLHAGVRYTVGLTLSAKRAKVSVGSNPWQRPDPLTNLAQLCGRYGGGGHAVVAGISFPPEEIDAARAAALTIVETLRQG